MSRNRKPLEMQSGNLTTSQQEEMKQIEMLITVGNEQLRSPPKWLVDTAARKEFERIVKEFDDVDIIGNLDLNNIGAYCNAYSFYLKATKTLKNEPFIIEKTLQNGIKIPIENPLIGIQKKYAEEMRKFAATCGLTIDSRMKAGATKVKKIQSDIEDEFGDI